MNECVHLEYDVDGNNFVSAGQATEKVKFCLKSMGINAYDIRRIAIAMYEGEINMVIHANGGKAIADIYVDRIEVRLVDTGKGIPDIIRQCNPGSVPLRKKYATSASAQVWACPTCLKTPTNSTSEVPSA